VQEAFVHVNEEQPLNSSVSATKKGMSCCPSDAAKLEKLSKKQQNANSEKRLVSMISSSERKSESYETGNDERKQLFSK
jgi:hypothetical protein